MFISKKKFEEALAKARMETEEKIFQHERISRMDEDFNRRIYAIDDRLCQLEGRIYQLEHPNGEKVEHPINPMR